MKLDDSLEFETFRIIEKSYDNPEDLTSYEKKRLRELGLEVK
jgi:hypothetical protein